MGKQKAIGWWSVTSQKLVCRYAFDLSANFLCKYYGSNDHNLIIDPYFNYTQRDYNESSHKLMVKVVAAGCVIIWTPPRH